MTTTTIHFGLATALRKLLKPLPESTVHYTKDKPELPPIRKILEEFERTGQLCGQKLREAGIEFSH